MAGVFFIAILEPFNHAQDPSPVTKFFQLIKYVSQTLLLLYILISTANAGSLPLLAAPTRFTTAIYSLANPQAEIFSQGMTAETLFPPASTQKLLTATAAQLELGDSFTFTTSVSLAAKDVIIKFGGDPTLKTEDIKQLLLSIKQSGIHNIEGDLWLDNSIFSGYEAAVGWPWDVLGVCYSAPSSAITLDENCIPGSIYTNQDGSTRVYIPEQYPVVVTTQATALDKEQQQQQLCDLELNALQSNRYQLSGCLTFRANPLPLKFAIRNTTLYAQNQIATLLEQLNIRLKGNIKVGTPPPVPQQMIAVKRSALLADLIKVMLQESDNLIANNLSKMIGHHYYQQPGSFANGVAAIKAILTAQGINLDSAQLYDGSGLSRNNRLSARQLIDVLNFIARNDDQLHLLDSLAVAGTNGTLQYRSSMRKPPIKGAIIAKSGSLYATHNMAGFGLNKSGKPTTLFVQLVSDYFPEKEDNSTELKKFEQGFYQYVVEKSQ